MPSGEARPENKMDFYLGGGEGLCACGGKRAGEVGLD